MRLPVVEGRTCALDMGQVRVGVALDDELGLMAHPRGCLPGRDLQKLVATLVTFAQEHAVTRFVLGLPLHMKGGEGDGARRVRGFAQTLADRTGIEVELWDERLSTVQARRALAASEVRGKKADARVDEASAVAILQAWLDARALHARSTGSLRRPSR